MAPKFVESIGIIILTFQLYFGYRLLTKKYFSLQEVTEDEPAAHNSDLVGKSFDVKATNLLHGRNNSAFKSRIFSAQKLKSHKSAVNQNGYNGIANEEGVANPLHTRNNVAFKNRKFLLNNPTLCSRHSNLTAFIFVQMSVSDFEGRTYLRERWLSPYLFKEPHVASAFMVGLHRNDSAQHQLEVEAEIHGDIIQGDFIDTYKNQTIKNVAAIEWISKYCTNAFYIIKTDADVFLHIVQIMDNLEKEMVAPNTFSCRKVRSSTSSRIVIPNSGHVKGPSPPYCAGPFYIHRGSLIKEYLETAMATPYTVWCQDVFMTGIVREAMDNVTISGLPGWKWVNRSIDAHKQYIDCSQVIRSYVIHRNDHQFHADFAIAWAAALQRLPSSLRQKVNETFLEEAEKSFPGCQL